MTATCFNSSLLHYYLQITVGDTQYLTKKTKVVHFIKKKHSIQDFWQGVYISGYLFW